MKKATRESSGRSDGTVQPRSRETMGDGDFRQIPVASNHAGGRSWPGRYRRRRIIEFRGERFHIKRFKIGLGCIQATTASEGMGQ